MHRGSTAARTAPDGATLTSLVGAVAFALLAGCDASPRDPVARPADGSAALTVRADGIGVVRVGMTLAELNAALGDSLTVSYTDFEGCDHVQPAALPPSVALMILDDSVARVEVDSSDVPTAEGARVGDTEAAVLALYGTRATVSPHKYTGPEGHYVTVADPADSTHLIIFETDGKVVTLFRAGRTPAVQFVEGCA
jgi:hypothetical protein